MGKRKAIYIVLAVVALASCKVERRAARYGSIYQQQTQTVMVAPINDRTSRRAVREGADSLYNASLNAAAMQAYLTASTPLVSKGYYVMGPLASAQVAASETRTGQQLRTEGLGDLYADLGIDAVLFIDLLDWKSTNCSWSLEAEYRMRSTRTGEDIMKVHVNATKTLPTDFKGNPRPLKADKAFAKSYGCDLETAQRCRLVEILNQCVLNDLPSGQLARKHETEKYLSPNPDRYTLRVHRDGSVEIFKEEEQ